MDIADAQCFLPRAGKKAREVFLVNCTRAMAGLSLNLVTVGLFSVDRNVEIASLQFVRCMGGGQAAQDHVLLKAMGHHFQRLMRTRVVADQYSRLTFRFHLCQRIERLLDPLRLMRESIHPFSLHAKCQSGVSWDVQLLICVTPDQMTSGGSACPPANTLYGVSYAFQSSQMSTEGHGSPHSCTSLDSCYLTLTLILAVLVAKSRKSGSLQGGTHPMTGQSRDTQCVPSRGDAC
jgi:hypothetical protein